MQPHLPPHAHCRGFCIIDGRIQKNHSQSLGVDAAHVVGLTGGRTQDRRQRLYAVEGLLKAEYKEGDKMAVTLSLSDYSTEEEKKTLD